ncbi:MAG: hypothetical protein HYU53_15660 [Acidobacteria bacterium]|nr:hypothetical protein [Acidobacteriota bacterium]
MRALSVIAAISGLYDLVVGASLLLLTGQMAALFGVVPPVPPIFGDLNGIFLIAIGIGYWFPSRDPVRYRAYLWVMGPLLKGAGALAFVLDYVFRGSPASFLLFAASDGTLALLTLVALVAAGSTRADRPRSR